MAKIDMAAIIAATNSGGFVHVNEKDAAKAVKDGLIEINTEMRDETGNVAARATPKGMASVPGNTSAPGATPSFAIVTGPALEKPKRGAAGRAAMYPFDQLPAPDANGNTAKFFVPATEKSPEPWKSLSSTVSAASRSFATITGTKPGKNKNGEDIQRNIYDFSRKFALIEGENNGVKGAWVERTK